MKNQEHEEERKRRENHINEQVEAETMAASAATDGVAATALRSVIQRVHQAAERSGRPPDRIRIVAVSKTKPVSVIRQVYEAGHRCFGENYVQEIVEKAAQVPLFSALSAFFFFPKDITTY